ncbi:hypothetical protein [Streptomyces sp. NPDC047014]|uniref:hypothetical protein n=1 Tax=Streptomyces sp. NPDC047014 TaxID=3155736 RepID=UPI0033FCE467
MPFQPLTVPRRARAPLALLVLLAFAATVLGCMIHDARATPATVTATATATTSSVVAVPVHPAHSAHGPSGIPRPGDHCLLHSFPRALQEFPVQRSAAFPPFLLAVLLALFASGLAGRVPRRGSGSAPWVRGGRETRTGLCCWRI